MPIRFQCPECQSKLKIGSHKVGTQKTCPYCGIDFVVPEQGNEELPVAQRYVDGVGLPNPSEATSRDTESKSKGAASPSDFEGMVAAPPIGTEADASRAGRPQDLSPTIEIPRRLIYTFGGLLTVVALFFFLFGVMTGRKLTPRRSAAPMQKNERCVITGTVHYREDNQRVADEGAIVIFMPKDSTPDVRPEGRALSPESVGAEESPDAQLVRTFGGEVVRVDRTGKFRTILTSGKEYDLVVVSKAKQDDDPPSRNLRANWGRVFVPLEELIGDRARYSGELATRGPSQVVPPVDFD